MLEVFFPWALIDLSSFSSSDYQTSNPECPSLSLSLSVTEHLAAYGSKWREKEDSLAAARVKRISLGRSRRSERRKKDSASATLSLFPVVDVLLCVFFPRLHRFASLFTSTPPLLLSLFLLVHDVRPSVRGSTNIHLRQKKRKKKRKRLLFLSICFRMLPDVQ